MFEVKMPTHVITLIFVATPFAFFSGFLFSQLIIHPCHLSSFGDMHNGIYIWISQSWEGLRACWDINAFAVLRMGK
jgi:hypothetical protein